MSNKSLSNLRDAVRELASLGLSPGTSGNFSVKTETAIFISASGQQADNIDVEDFVEVNSSGTVRTKKPSKELPLHKGFYTLYPEYRVIIHLHSPASMAASLLEPWSKNSAIPPVSPYFVMKVGRTPLAPYADPGSAELGVCLNNLTGNFRAALLSNHGCIVGGKTVSEAMETAIELEKACELHLMTRMHSPNYLDQETCLRLAAKHNSNW